MEELYFVFAVFEHQMGCPGGTVVKNPPANAGYAGLDLWVGRFPGVRNDNPLQYARQEYLENSMDRWAWWAIVCGVTRSQTQLNRHTCIQTPGAILKGWIMIHLNHSWHSHSFLSNAGLGTDLQSFLSNDVWEEIVEGTYGKHFPLWLKKESFWGKSLFIPLALKLLVYVWRCFCFIWEISKQSENDGEIWKEPWSLMTSLNSCTNSDSFTKWYIQINRNVIENKEWRPTLVLTHCIYPPFLQHVVFF